MGLRLGVLSVGVTHRQRHCELAAVGKGRASSLMRMRAVAGTTWSIRHELLLLQLLQLLLLLMLIVR